MVRPRRHGDRLVDKNDPTEYIGGDSEFVEGYYNNARTELDRKPTSFPLDNTWRTLVGSSYHKGGWVPQGKKDEDAKAKRRLERDPNHPVFQPRHGTLRWWNIKITLLGTDKDGKQWISFRKGQSEPIFFRIGKGIEVYFKGNRFQLEED